MSVVINRLYCAFEFEVDGASVVKEVPLEYVNNLYNGRDFVEFVGKLFFRNIEPDSFKLVELIGDEWGKMHRYAVEDITFDDLLLIADVAAKCQDDEDMWNAYTALVADEYEVLSPEGFKARYVGTYDDKEAFLAEFASNRFGDIEASGIIDFLDWRLIEDVALEEVKNVESCNINVHVFTHL